MSGTEDLSFGTKFKCKFFVIHHNCSVDPLIFHNGIGKSCYFTFNNNLNLSEFI